MAMENLASTYKENRKSHRHWWWWWWKRERMCLEVRQDHANTLKSIEDLVAIYRCKRTTLCSTGSMNHLVASQTEGQ